MPRRSTKTTELIELTSKPLKLQSAASALMLFSGLVILFIWGEPAGTLTGVLLSGIGFIWHIITRIRIWWNHR